MTTNQDFENLVKRCSEEKVYGIEAITFGIGVFLTLLVAAIHLTDRFAIITLPISLAFLIQGAIAIVTQKLICGNGLSWWESTGKMAIMYGVVYIAIGLIGTYFALVVY